MDIGNERKKEPIDDKGEAHFENLRAGDSVRLNIDFSEPYISTHPDSIYVVQPQRGIYLEMVLKGIDRVNGKVFFMDQPLEGVRVEIDTLSCHTDRDGNFSMAIPEGLQKDTYEVWFKKQGFKSLKTVALPETGKPLQVILEKSGSTY